VCIRRRGEVVNPHWVPTRIDLNSKPAHKHLRLLAQEFDHLCEGWDGTATAEDFVDYLIAVLRRAA
jgi:hypothetical protein